MEICFITCQLLIVIFFLLFFSNTGKANEACLLTASVCFVCVYVLNTLPCECVCVMCLQNTRVVLNGKKVHGNLSIAHFGWILTWLVGSCAWRELWKNVTTFNSFFFFVVNPSYMILKCSCCVFPFCRGLVYCVWYRSETIFSDAMASRS